MQVVVPQNMNRRRLFNYVYVSAALLILVCIVAGGIYYYLKIYRNRDLFLQETASIDEGRLESMNFQKISYENLYSYFIPNSWTLVDRNLGIYGDILNGSNAYVKAYPNSLGILTNEVCGELSKQAFEKFQNQKLYASSTLANSRITKVKSYTGCYLEIDSTIAGKSFRIKQFYILKKNNIYQVFVQTRKDLPTEEEISNTILESVDLES